MADQPLDIGYDPQLSQDFGPRVTGLLQRLPGFTVGEGYRSPQAQAAAYAKGRTAPGSIVTYAGPNESYHQWGSAVDVVPPPGMGQDAAARLVAQVIRDNPDLGVRGIGAWDPFHVQLNAPLAAIRRGASGLPAYAETNEAAPIGGADPRLAHGVLSAAADNPVDRATLRPRDEELTARSAPGNAPNTPPSPRDMATMMLAASRAERDQKEWDAVFKGLQLKPVPGPGQVQGGGYAGT